MIKGKFFLVLASLMIALVALVLVACSSGVSELDSDTLDVDVGIIGDGISSSSVNEVQPVVGDTTIITLKGTSAEFVGKNVNIAQNNSYGTIVEITGSGIYLVQGTLSQGFVAVSKKDLNVTVILSDVDIVSKNYAALTSLKKSNVTVVLAENTTNKLTDSGEGCTDGKYNLGYDSEEQPNATLLVRNDLTIRGSGKLVINGKCNNGIGSRANLRIEGGDISVDAVNDALKGNDAVTISGGTFNLISGNKAIKSDVDITINSGTFSIDSKDDAIHSDSTITINNGTFAISSGDDAIRAEKRLTINGGNINVTKCYEGLEAYDIDLNGGFVKIKSSNDGINVSAGKSSSSGGSSSSSRRQGMGGGGMGMEPVINGTLTITGGEYYIEGSDAVDSNGNIFISGGTVVAFGPSSTNTVELSIDYDGTFTVTGGFIIGLGYGTNMLKAPNSSNSMQNSFLATFNQVSSGSFINVSSDSGTEVVTIKTIGSTRSIVLSSPLLKQGAYRISSGGSHSGSANALGVYQGGTYSGGTSLKTVTFSSNGTATVN